MKQVIKHFGRLESNEVKAVRAVVRRPGFGQSIERIDYVDKDGNVTEYGTGTRPVGERYTLTDEGAAEHDRILGVTPL